MLLAAGRLRDRMTSGPDSIPSFVVKDCIRVFSTPLVSLFNLSLRTNTFPEVWKRARVCPVFKAGDPASLSNYRPVSILSNFSKVFEIILYNRIYPLLRSKITPMQHGFMSNRSTATNLTVFTQFVSETLDNNGQVDVIYTDFSKAFDRMDHHMLLNKLGRFGFGLSFIRFLQSYLFSREQYVAYGGYNSYKYMATSGVPQGSNLGPLLFLLFINDIIDVISCSGLLFADDFKIFSSVSSVSDCRVLQTDLDRVQMWCDVNRLQLNLTKCKVVSYTRRKVLIGGNYSLGGSVLSRCESIKDLGVLFDSKLSFAGHIHAKVAEASRAYGFIVRNCGSFGNILTLTTLYFAFVRSKLEYCSVVWSPYYVCYKILIERVQRKFLKYLSFREDGTYPERGVAYEILTSRFNIQTLHFRRHCASISFLYKLLHGGIDCSALLSQINYYVPGFNSRSTAVFYCSRARTNLCLKSPLYVMCSNFNKISHLCDINGDGLAVILRSAVHVFADAIFT